MRGDKGRCWQTGQAKTPRPDESSGCQPLAGHASVREPPPDQVKATQVHVGDQGSSLSYAKRRLSIACKSQEIKNVCHCQRNSHFEVIESYSGFGTARSTITYPAEIADICTRVALTTHANGTDFLVRKCVGDARKCLLDNLRQIQNRHKRAQFANSIVHDKKRLKPANSTRRLQEIRTVMRAAVSGRGMYRRRSSRRRAASSSS